MKSIPLLLKEKVRIAHKVQITIEKLKQKQTASYERIDNAILESIKNSHITCSECNKSFPVHEWSFYYETKNQACSRSWGDTRPDYQIIIEETLLGYLHCPGCTQHSRLLEHTQKEFVRALLKLQNDKRFKTVLFREIGLIRYSESGYSWTSNDTSTVL